MKQFKQSRKTVWSQLNNPRGFTLVEVLIGTGIMVTTLLLFSGSTASFMQQLANVRKKADSISLANEIGASIQRLRNEPNLCASNLSFSSPIQPGVDAPMQFTVGGTPFAAGAEIGDMIIDSLLFTSPQTINCSTECIYSGAIVLTARSKTELDPNFKPKSIRAGSLYVKTDLAGKFLSCDFSNDLQKSFCEDLGGVYNPSASPKCAVAKAVHVACPPDEYMIGIQNGQAVCRGMAVAVAPPKTALNADSGRNWISSTITLDICKQMDMNKVTSFAVTSDITGSDWIAPPNKAVRTVNFTKGVASQSVLMSKTGVPKENKNILSYDGNCTVTGGSQYHGKSSNSKWTQVRLTQVEALP